MEIYRDTTGKTLDLSIPNATVSKVEFYRNGEKVSESTSSTVTVPYSITHMDGHFSVKWYYAMEGSDYTRVDTHQVVTPLFSAEELKDFNDSFATLEDKKIVELERLVRNIIEVNTGQSFGYEETSVVVYGKGESFLTLPRRIVNVNSISNGPLAFPFAYRPIKAGFAVEADVALDAGVVTSNGSIVDPYALNYRLFPRGAQFTVAGAFGWESVPSDIKQAALLLAELFSCREATWRDRYMKAVTAADWRFDVDGRAFSGTGSVSVDQILSSYTVGTMAII